MNGIRNLRLVVCLLTVALSLAPVAQALDAIPLYEPVDIGTIIRDAYPTAGISSGWALNESGDVGGAAHIDSEFQAFIYTEEWGLEILPPLPGWTNHIGQDISDRDAQGIVLIVGGAGQTTQLSDSDPGHAVMWRYDTVQGQVVEIVDVGHLPGNGVSELNAVNNNGLAVGYSRLGLVSGFYEPMVYEVATDTLHPLALSGVPVDINDANQVLAGTHRAQLSQDPGTGVISVSSTFDLSTEPGVKVPSVTSALNNLGWASGTAYMGYSIGGRSVLGAVLYDNVIWDVVWSGSSVDRSAGLNIHGDVVGQSGPRLGTRAALYIRALDQVFPIEDLTDPPTRWVSARDINDAGWIAGGGAGAVLWKRIGDLPVPTPPANLTAVPHEPTWVQPWNGITLNWEDTSTLTRTFTIERSLSGADNWVVIRSGWSPLSYNDTSVELATTYDYRVRASGVATGLSEPSNVATATSPDNPLDTEAPVVNFVTPLNGETVTGTVPIVVEATDNQALEHVDVVLVIDSSRQKICEDFIGGATASTTLSCNWNTRDLLTRWYTLEAHASDPLANWDLEIIQVWLEGTGQCNNSGVCDPGEDCTSCPNDCPGKTGGNPSRRFCCGDGVCSSQEDSAMCSLDCGTPPVCGDGTCDTGEDPCGCPGDCGSPPPSETGCGDGVDNDCDGPEDCDDPDCDGANECLCGPKNATCSSGAECCSGTCKRNGRCQ